MENNILKLTENNDIKGVKKAIKEGADLNIKDEDGWTALMQASQRGYFEIVELLVKAGVDVNFKNKWGITALMIAIHRQKKIAKLLIDASDYAKEDYKIMQVKCDQMVELLTPAFSNSKTLDLLPKEQASFSFLKLPKYITSRYWYSKPNTLYAYLYLLSQATYLEKTKINKIVLNKHQILTSSKALESALKLTRTKVRTVLEHLKETGDIEITTTNKYSIITLLFEGSVNNKNFEKESLPIADIINKIAKLLDSDEIEIEIVGSWLWISDDSKQYKNEIKEAGFRFSGAKKMWFYCCKTEYKASKTNIDIDKLRLKYGSEILKNKSQLQEWFLNEK